MDWGQVAALMTEMEDEGRAMLRDAGVADDLVRFERSADMRYVGQGYEIPVPLPPGALDGSRVDEVVQAFYRVYRERYSRFRTDVAVEALTWRVTASGPPPAIDLRVADDRSADASEAVKGRRRAFFGEAGRFVDCVVYDRYRLGPGAAFAGPAIVEERESTVVVGPSARASIDAYRNLVMEMD
jgi:N-methylhydantoinase A